MIYDILGAFRRIAKSDYFIRHVRLSILFSRMEQRDFLWTDFDEVWHYGSGQGEVADFCECRNEPSGAIKCGEFLEYLRTC